MEVACPIYQDSIKKRILEFLDIMFADDVKTRVMNSRGEYEKVENKKNLIAQEKFIELAKAIAREKDLGNKSELIPNNISIDENDKAKSKKFFEKIKDFFRK